jgi:hypothetical protein
VTGLVGRAAVAVRLGFAATRGRSGALHRWALVVASFAGVLVSWTVVASDAVADHRSQRILERGPVYTTDEAAAIGNWYDTIDYLGDRQFLVIQVAPLAADAAPPPGLPRWPGPGEAFLSSALLAADDRMTQRYGDYAGTVSGSGLRDSTEWLVYTRPRDPASFGRTGHTTLISGFGQVEDQFAPADLPPAIGSEELLWLLLVVVAFPALVLTIVAVRTSAERRDRRLAILEALGAPWSARAWVLVGEAALPVAAGAALGAGAAVATTLVDTPIPGTGFTVWASDLAGTRWSILALWAGVVLGLLALVALLQVRPAGANQTRPQSLTSRLPYWPQVVFPLALAATILTASFGAGTAAEFGLPPVVIAFVVAMVLTLATLPAVSSAVVSWCGTRIARLDSASALLGGRWLSARPDTTARLVAAVAVGLGVTSQLAVIGTLDVYRTGWRPDAASDQAVVVYSRGASEQARARFLAVAGADQVLEIRAGRGSVPTLVGSCDALERIGELARCPDRPARSTDVFAPASALERAVLFETDVVATVPPPDTEPWGFLVLNAGGRDGVEQVQRTANQILPLVTAHSAGQLARAVEPSMSIRIRWLAAAAAAGVLLLVGAGGLAVLGLVAAQTGSLGALGGLGAPPRLFARLAWWNVGLPLLLTLSGSVAMAAFLASLAVRLRSSGEIPWGFLGASASVCVLLAMLMTVVAAVLTARAAPSWRPTGD